MFSARGGAPVVFSMVMLLLVLSAHGYSGWGHPWARYGGVHDSYDHGYGHSYHPAFFDNNYDRYGGEDAYDGYFQRRNPCPQYRPVQLSGWRAAADQTLSVDVELPNVRNQDVRASLSSDGSTIHVKAWRPVPPRGLACLPPSASVSGDGRHEILGAEVRIPEIADGHGATMRELRGGLRFIAPRRHPTPTSDRSREHASTLRDRAHAQADPQSAVNAPRPSSTPMDVDGPSRSVRGDISPPRRAPPSGVASAASVAGGVDSGSQSPRRYAQPLMRRAMDLPTSTGISVEDAPFPWPEKAADASEGWLDNRGEFQFY